MLAVLLVLGGGSLNVDFSMAVWYTVSCQCIVGLISILISEPFHLSYNNIQYKKNGLNVIKQMFLKIILLLFITN